MEILRVLLIIIEVVACLLLVGVILLQKSKGEGLGMAFGSGMGETLFGSRAGNVLTKITVTLALIFLANTAILGVLFTGSHETSIIDQRTAPLPEQPAERPAPAGPAAAQPAAPTRPEGIAPTLPGSSLEEQAPAPAQVAPAETPAETPAEAPAEQPQP